MVVHTGIRVVIGLHHHVRAITAGRVIGNAAAGVIYGYRVAGEEEVAEDIDLVFKLKFTMYKLKSVLLTTEHFSFLVVCYHTFQSTAMVSFLDVGFCIPLVSSTTLTPTVFFNSLIFMVGYLSMASITQ